MTEFTIGYGRISKVLQEQGRSEGSKTQLSAVKEITRGGDDVMYRL